MFCSKVLRSFSQYPGLTFQNGRALIMNSVQSSGFFRLGNYASLGVPALMLIRIITKYSILSTFNFFTSSLVFFGTSVLTKHWLDFSRSYIKELYLLKSGKYIEITHFGLINETVKIRISDIINPEDSLSTKVKMQMLGTWVLETNKGHSFCLMQDSHAYHKEVLKNILRGVDIDLTADSDQSDIIDI